MELSDVDLLVKCLPENLPSEDIIDFLNYFGAKQVYVYPSSIAYRRNCAIARFENTESAKFAMMRMHQQKLFNKPLIVIFATLEEVSKYLHISDIFKRIEKLSSDKIIPENVKQRWKDFQRSLISMAPHLDVDFCISPVLKYQYPSPTKNVLINICKALMVVPKFYTQVLHLMNKMSLPCPFADNVDLHPLIKDFSPEEICKELDIKKLSAEHEYNEEIIESAEMDVVDSENEDFVEESELESDEDNAPKEIIPSKKLKITKTNITKRPKHLVPHYRSVVKNRTSVTPADVFEVSTSVDVKPMKLNLNRELTLPSNVTEENQNKEKNECKNETSGFGILLPVTKEANEDSKHNKEMTDFNNESHHEFITDEDINKNRLSKESMATLSVFHNYSPGNISNRLYIKNIAKQVTEQDLKFIFGHYVKWDSDEECKMFDLRLMTEGRMKGQAFISMPTVSQAEKALNDVNGYVLKGKPLVVQFARSARPKEQINENI